MVPSSHGAQACMERIRDGCSAPYPSLQLRCAVTAEPMTLGHRPQDAFRAAGDCDAARTECSLGRTSVFSSPVRQVPTVARVSAARAGEIEGCPGPKDRDW